MGPANLVDRFRTEDTVHDIRAEGIGCAGVVIDGAVRDFGWIRANDFPVYAAGVTHRGPYKCLSQNPRRAVAATASDPGDRGFCEVH